jgi:hypothetical protein
MHPTSNSKKITPSVVPVNPNSGRLQNTPAIKVNAAIQQNHHTIFSTSEQENLPSVRCLIRPIADIFKRIFGKTGPGNRLESPLYKHQYDARLTRENLEKVTQAENKMYRGDRLAHQLHMGMNPFGICAGVLFTHTGMRNLAGYIAVYGFPDKPAAVDADFGAHFNTTVRYMTEFTPYDANAMQPDDFIILGRN